MGVLEPVRMKGLESRAYLFVLDVSQDGVVYVERGECSECLCCCCKAKTDSVVVVRIVFETKSMGG